MNAAILTYHHVANPPEHHPKKNLFVSPREFSAQMSFFSQKGYRVVSLDQIHSALMGGEPLPQKSVAITFDDGFEDNFTNAFPILLRHGFPATIFMVSSCVRHGGSVPNDKEAERYLSAAQLQTMAKQNIAIGSHSRTHTKLGRLPINDAMKEIASSKHELESILQKPVNWFCYPFGSFNPQIEESVRQAGFIGAVSVIRDNRIFKEQIYHLPRIMVMPNISLFKFEYYFSALYHFLHYFKNRKRWRKYI